MALAVEVLRIVALASATEPRFDTAPEMALVADTASAEVVEPKARPWARSLRIVDRMACRERTGDRAETTSLDSAGKGRPGDNMKPADLDNVPVCLPDFAGSRNPASHRHSD